LEEIEETELWKDRQTEKLGCQDILGRRWEQQLTNITKMMYMVEQFLINRNNKSMYKIIRDV
jgi:hypothetical protein